VNDVYQGRSVDQVTANLRAMYDRAAAAGIPVVAGSIVPYNTATADANRKMHEINAWIAAQGARDRHVIVVDTRAAAAARDDVDRLAASPDGLHPDVEGYRAMAEAILPGILRALSRR
jgi:lysophospholipase L1-like esterase